MMKNIIFSLMAVSVFALCSCEEDFDPYGDLRNKYMLETFNKFLFLSIKNTGNLEKLFYDCMSKNKQVFLFDHFSNIPWSENGAELVSAGNWSMLK